jgi:hypothetical protein
MNTETTRNQKNSVGKPIKFLNLRWWIWIIIIIVAVILIGSIAVPMTALGTDLGKIMNTLLGPALALSHWFANHSWAIWLAFFAYAFMALGGFGKAKTFLAEQSFREQAEGKSQEEFVNEIAEKVEKKLEEKKNEKEEKGEESTLTNEEIKEISDTVLVEEVQDFIQNEKDAVNAGEKTSQEAQEIARDAIDSANDIDDLPEVDQEDINKDVDSIGE